MQIKLTNKAPGQVKVTWAASSVPPNAGQIQFRSVSNVSPSNMGLGFDVISTTQSIQAGEVVLDNPSIIKSGVLLQVAAAAISTAEKIDYTDVEGSNVAAIVPL